jgi:hypothetical protein
MFIIYKTSIKIMDEYYYFIIKFLGIIFFILLILVN